MEEKENYITLECKPYTCNTLTFKQPDPKDMKVKIWGKELTSVAEWEDFLKIVDEKQEEIQQLKEQFERKMDLIGELDGYFEDIFTELDRNWREDGKWRGGMKGWYEEAIREIKELKEQLVDKNKEIEKLKIFMSKWHFENFESFENHYNYLMSLKNREQLMVENEAMKETIANLLGQKKTSSKEIYKQICNKIRDFIDNNDHSEENDAKQSSESVVYTRQLYKFLDQIEQARENLK